MKKVVPAVPKYEATKSLLNACHAAMYEGAKNLASAYATIQQQQFILAAGAAWKPIPQFVPSQLTVVRKPQKSQVEPYCCKAYFDYMAQKMFGARKGRPPHDKGCPKCSK